MVWECAKPFARLSGFGNFDRSAYLVWKILQTNLWPCKPRNGYMGRAEEDTIAKVERYPQYHDPDITIWKVADLLLSH